MNLIEILSAFLEGILLIFTPCILLVLPLVLSAGADGGRQRPLGIITGFVLSFSAFAAFSRFLVQLLHIDVDIIKSASLWLLFALGLVMVSEKLSNIFSSFTQKLAGLGNAATGGEGSRVTIHATRGIVAGFEHGSVGNLIKTDASITQGNSGGAAVDADGKLVGIPTSTVENGSGQSGFVRPIGLLPPAWREQILHPY